MLERQVDLPRILLAAVSSGTGKTTLCCGLLALLKKRGFAPCAFKCGPDYIDPMFHREVLGLPSRNLDLFFSSEDQVRLLLSRHGAGHGIAVLEGVMGLYDGVGGTQRASSYHLALATKTPVVLVMDARGSALTLAAVIKGLANFREKHVVGGVILNRCTKALFQFLRPMIEGETEIPVLGYLPWLPDCGLESRHLGLVMPQEIPTIQKKLDGISDILEETLDVEALFTLAGSAPPLPWTPQPEDVSPKNMLVAVAWDEAFSFYYPDNLEELTRCGAQLAFFSPLHDTALPQETVGVYLGGGYPELWTQMLSENTAIREEIRVCGKAGMPILAECGGFLYLQRELEDKAGKSWPMVGLLPGRGTATSGLRRFGYVTLTVEKDTQYLKIGEQLPGHEFHRWDCTENGEDCVAHRPSNGVEYPCIVARENLFAGFPHLYLPTLPEFSQRFMAACREYKEGRTT